MVRAILLGVAAAGVLLMLTLKVEGASPLPPAAVAQVRPATFTSKDTANVRELCGLAQRNVALTLEQTTAVGQYCQDLLARLAGASEAAAAAAPVPAAPAEAPAKGAQ